MRIVTVRGWSKEYKKMWESPTVNFATNEMLQSDGEWYEVDKLLMPTGLKDKNGKEIYEGDIVRYYDSTTMWLTSRVIDVGGAFALSTSENPILLYDFQHNYVYDGKPIPELDVIGNIYENPELSAPSPDKESK